MEIRNRIRLDRIAQYTYVFNIYFDSHSLDGRTALTS